MWQRAWALTAPCFVRSTGLTDVIQWLAISHLWELAVNASKDHMPGALAGLLDPAKAQEVTKPHAGPVGGAHSRGAPVEALALLHNVLHVCQLVSFDATL